MLVQHHADVHVTNNRSETALDLAAQYGRLDTVVTLLSSIAASPSTAAAAARVTVKSPLHLAASNGHCIVVAKLLEAGFDINRSVSWFASCRFTSYTTLTTDIESAAGGMKSVFQFNFLCCSAEFE